MRPARKRAEAASALACALLTLAAGRAGAALDTREEKEEKPVESPRDGQADFDFVIGSWTVHNRRLRHPLTGSDSWNAFEATSVARKIWGRARQHGRVRGRQPFRPHPGETNWTMDFTRAVTVLELRQYTLHPGARDTLVDLFDAHFVESQEALGMRVFGQFRDTGNADRFVWIRGFEDMESRRKALDAFYTGPVWVQHLPRPTRPW